MSKVEILVAAIKELEELRKKLQELGQNANVIQIPEKRNIEQIKVGPETKDASCNTDIENKENHPVSKCLNAHKKVQVNLLRKKRKKSEDSASVIELAATKPCVSSSGTQTPHVEEKPEIRSDSDKTSTTAPDAGVTSESNCMALVPFSDRTATSNQTSTVLSSQSVDPIQTASNAASHLSNTMRMTPALISTPIMTPSLFISNYPFVVSQIPQPVYIVNNKTEVNTTVNKVVAVKSKSISGHVPLPPLKKNVAVKKPPRKKRVLKKKIKDVTEVQDVMIENKNIDNSNTKDTTVKEMKKSSSDQSKDKAEAMKNMKIETVVSVNKNVVTAPENETICDKVVTKDTTNDPKRNEQSSAKHSEDISLHITPPPISSGKLLERLDSNSSLLNLESNRKSYSPASQDTSHINDTSAISNLDIENFSLLTANILSGIDANDTSETNLSSNLGKMLEDKELDCTTKTGSLITLSNEVLSSERIGHDVGKVKIVEKPAIALDKTNETVVTKPRETIQVRKGLLQNEPKLTSQQNTVPIASSSSYNSFNALSTSTQSTNYPNFSLSLSQDMRNRAKPISEANSIVSSKLEVSATYTMTGPTYSGNLNYTGYYSNSNNAHTSLQQLYSNQHTNNIISSSYSKSYDSQRPYYADQPSTNFTFSLTSVGKTQAKYVSSGTKLQSMNQIQPPNIPEACKKYNSKSGSYNYSGENVSAKNVTTHSIARLNSKYDNHKENDTPFYLGQDAACTKANVVQKATYNQSVFSNNSSCARYPQQQQLQAPIKQGSTNKSAKSTSLTTHQPQMSSRYDIDWMSSSEIKPSTNDFQLFPSLESAPMNQNSYYSSSISNFDINRKTSDLYFAHPPGEENLPWSPSRMSNLLDAPHLSGNQCFPSTLPNLHGDLALNTLSTGGPSRPSSIFETPTKASVSSYNPSYSATKEAKRLSNPVDSQQNNSFSVRQLVDINQPSKSNVPSDKMSNMKRKSTSRKEGDAENFSNDIIPYENQKSNIYSAESLINPRHSSKNKSWHTEAGHLISSHETNQNNPLFTMEPTGDNQYNYATTRYDPKFFNQNYVTSFVDNSFSNTTQNFHNFSKSQPFTFADSNNPAIDYHQSSLGNTMNSFLSHHDVSEKHSQNYYPQSSKTINPVNMDSSSSRNHSSSASATTSHSSKKSKSSSHHVPTSTHHGLIMNYDFPVPPVTPSLTYFSTHDWKSTPTEPYPTIHHNVCNSNSYVNSSSNLYSQNILQNSQSQNLVTGLSSNVSNNGHSQNTSNSLTNFNLSTICPEINDKVRQQNW